jgi:AraC-like DNA-binding protein
LRHWGYRNRAIGRTGDHGEITLSSGFPHTQQLEPTQQSCGFLARSGATVKIAALISASCQTALRRILWTGHSLSAVRSPAELETLVSGGGCELVILDPTGMRDEVFSGTLKSVVQSGASFCIWARKSAPTYARIVQAAVFLPTTALLRGINDANEDLRAMVRLTGSSTATAMILHRLAGHVLQLPRDSIVRRTAMFCGIPIPDSVESYTTGAGRSSRTVQRRFVEAHLGTPGRFLKIVRVARAWELLKTTAMSLSDVATACGFSSEQAMSRQFSLCVGVPPRRAVRRVTQDAFVERLLGGISGPEL